MSATTESSTRQSDDLLRVGLFWPAHRTQMPSPTVARANPNVVDLDFQRRVAREVEAAGFDFALIADGYSGSFEAARQIGYSDPCINPILWALPLFDVTTTLGVITTMHPSFLEPVQIAAYGAAMDHASNGRWGWNITPGYREEEAQLFGFDGLPDHDLRYDLAEDAVEIAIRLWSGKPISYRGRSREVEGRLDGPAPVQRPYPVLVNAGSSARGKTFAGRLCDYLFTNSHEFSFNARLTAEMAGIAKDAGRPEPARLLLLCQSLLRDEPGAAQRELQTIKLEQDAVKSAVTATALKNTKGAQVRDEMETATRINETDLVGTPDEVAAKIVHAYHEHALRGILITMPNWWPEDLRRYARVFDALREAGVWLPAAQRQSLW